MLRLVYSSYHRDKENSLSSCFVLRGDLLLVGIQVPHLSDQRAIFAIDKAHFPTERQCILDLLGQALLIAVIFQIMIFADF